MHAIAASAVLALTRPTQASAVVTPIRVVRSTPAGPRFLRLRSRITFDGATGDCVTVMDFRTGRSAEHVDAGVMSYSDGFDGRRQWSADVTGMPVIEGNAETLRDAAVWNTFLGAPEREHPEVRTLRTTPASMVLRLRYRSLRLPIDVTVDRASGYVQRIDDPIGGETSVSSYADYRRDAGVVFPHVLHARTRYGITREVIFAAEAPASIAASEFEPPAPPDDTTLTGVTSVPMLLDRGSPVVPVRIDDGPVLHMLLDSGSSNLLTPAAARRLRLKLSGEGKVGGVGTGVVRERYTRVRRVAVGSAELRDQPFEVLDYAEPGIDGALGCELFERFAVRFDFAKRSVLLARDASQLGMLGTAMPMRMTGCTPEIDGSVDGIGGPLMIDTGSAVSLDVLTPAVKRYGMLARYGSFGRVRGGGIGGDTTGLLVRARTVRLGPIAASAFRLDGRSMRGVPVVLQTTASGALSSTSDLGNVGTLLLEMFSPTFDYRSGTLWLLPKGD
ncbi:MAG TPA: retropepsin-like aspartic protease [Candidatus Limnocylindrales bacterium]|nr:retropepsin-like aspartic protease [Candidatus Limnocylindrales bacterium]